MTPNVPFSIFFNQVFLDLFEVNVESRYSYVSISKFHRVPERTLNIFGPSVHN